VGKEINLEEIGKRGIGKKGDFFLGKKTIQVEMEI